MSGAMAMRSENGQSLRSSGNAAARDVGVLEGLFRETESLTKGAEMLRERAAALASRVMGAEPPRAENAANVNAGGAGSQLEAFHHEITRLGRVLGEVGEQLQRLERL